MTDSKAPSHAMHGDSNSKVMLGFWMYLMTDCVLFACLFAAYMVLHNGTYGGPSSQQLFHLPFVLGETMLLLTSSYTSGLALLSAQQGRRGTLFFWLIVTFLLGLAFVWLEIDEFSALCAAGNSWKRSAFLSAYFTLVGTHGFHVSTGLLWILVLLGQFFWKGLTVDTLRRLTCFSLFWHFLDIVWIFIFTIVYLMGVL